MSKTLQILNIFGLPQIFDKKEKVSFIQKIDKIFF